MRYLLDTHVLLWWMNDDSRLGAGVRAVLADRANRLFWSTASTWEVAIKLSIGKLTLPDPLDRYLETRLVQQGIAVLPVSQAHAVAVVGLPMHHRDPFDRMLIAQATVEGMTLMTNNRAIAAYDLAFVWE